MISQSHDKYRGYGDFLQLKYISSQAQWSHISYKVANGSSNCWAQ